MKIGLSKRTFHLPTIDFSGVNWPAVSLREALEFFSQVDSQEDLFTAFHMQKSEKLNESSQKKG